MAKIDTIQELLKFHLSNIILKELSDPRLGIISVNHVKLSPDRRYAKVYISVLGNADDKKQSLDILKNASGFLRLCVSKAVSMRHTPEFSFLYDSTIEQAEKIEKALEKIHRENKS